MPAHEPTESGLMPPDIYTKRLLYYLIAGTRGGVNRAKILKTLKDTPKNANQLAQEMKLDYKTVQHHIEVLIKNRLIEPSSADTYGTLYFLSPRMEESYPILEEIWAKIGST